MQVTEKMADGLRRELKVVVGAGEIGARFAARLDEIKDKVQLKGFRKGKVPVNHLKKVGVPDDRIIGLENPDHTTVIDTLMAYADTDVVACAMGNIIGLGDNFVKGLSALSHTSKEPA